MTEKIEIRHTIEETCEFVTIDMASNERIVETGDSVRFLPGLKMSPGKTISISDPRLWDIDDPHLYHLKSEVLVDGNVTDTVITRFGLREINLTTDEGFFLNGRKVKLSGVCQHHDLGALGAAVSKGAMRRQLNILRAMGVNAIRTAHNPPHVLIQQLYAG